MFFCSSACVICKTTSAIFAFFSLNLTFVLNYIMSSFGINLGILDVINFLAIAPCFVSKLPQVLLILKTKDVRGVSFESVLLDIFCYVNTGSFFFYGSYPILQYLEYPLLLAQTVLLLILIGFISDRKARSLAWFLIFVCQALVFSVLPKYIALSLIATNTVIGSISKLTQISAIVRSGTSGNVSFTAYFFNGLASSCRLASMFLTGTGESVIRLNFWISVFGNLGVLIAIYLYKEPSAKKTD